MYIFLVGIFQDNLKGTFFFGRGPSIYYYFIIVTRIYLQVIIELCYMDYIDNSSAIRTFELKFFNSLLGALSFNKETLADVRSKLALLFQKLSIALL